MTPLRIVDAWVGLYSNSAASVCGVSGYVISRTGLPGRFHQLQQNILPLTRHAVTWVWNVGDCTVKGSVSYAWIGRPSIVKGYPIIHKQSFPLYILGQLYKMGYLII